MQFRLGSTMFAVTATLACGGGGGSDEPLADTTGAPSSEGSVGSVTVGSETSTSSTSSGSQSSTQSGGSETTGGLVPSVRYDAVQQKSAHNSFQRDEAIFDQLVYHRVRSLEFDIHVGKVFEPTQPGIWYVYHTDVTDDETWCVRLGHCLDAVGSFTHAAPDHEVVTVWIDLKDPWDAQHGPGELDLALGAAFGEALITGPELIALAGCADAPSIQQGLTDPGCGWPTLEALRGRVLVVLTGGESVLRTYHDDAPAERRALVALPAGGGATTLDEAADWAHTAVFNFAAADVQAVAPFVDAGLVARVWDCNDEASWNAAVDAGAQHIATDKVSAHADPWARTHDDRGWPFTCKADCAVPEPVPEAPIIGFEIDSGDLWNDADSAWFLHDDRSGDADGTWQAFVSTPNSHVEPFAKACLMARASVDVGAPYFAVCRLADDEPLRVQWRADQGGTSTAIENPITPDNTVDAPGAAFIRLRIDQGGTCVAGEGSADGATWVEIGSRCFAQPLALQGVTTSAHNDGGQTGDAIRLLLGNVTLDAPGRPMLGRGRDDFAASVAIGSAAAQVYDGVQP